MLRLCSNITVGDISFNFLNEVEINRSWQSLTNTGRMIIPRKLNWQQRDIVAGNNPLITRGSKVNIQLGYNNQLNTYFSGYVSQVNIRTPLELQFEDEMWLLKQVVVNFSFRAPTLQDIINEVEKQFKASAIFAKHNPSVSFKCIDIQMGQLRVKNLTIAKLFEFIRTNYGLQTFIRNGVVYTGLAYYTDQQVKVARQFDWNIITDNLEYRRLDDQKIKVKAISTYPNNTKIEYDTGDLDGDLRTLNYYNVSEADLKVFANNEIQKLKYEGFFGSFETFGDIYMDHGYAVQLVDKKLPDRNGLYLIKAVKTTFGINGFRNNVELDRKIG